jgi:hypothetical protein
MEDNVGLVVGFHNRNELIVIRRDDQPGVRAPIANSPDHWNSSASPVGVVLISGSLFPLPLPLLL